MTNFEKISKSPEALAKILLLGPSCDFCAFRYKRRCRYKYDECQDGVMSWLTADGSKSQIRCLSCGGKVDVE